MTKRAAGRATVTGDGRRAALVAELNAAAREHSTSTVLFHTAINERHGLSATEGKTLDLLARLGPLTAGQLVEHSGLAPASVTELIDRLEAKGFARRERDARDRRRVVVELIPERLAELAAAFDDFGAEAQALWRDYTDDELAVVLRFLRQASAFGHRAAAGLREPRGAGPASPRAAGGRTRPARGGPRRE